MLARLMLFFVIGHAKRRDLCVDYKARAQPVGILYLSKHRRNRLAHRNDDWLDNHRCPSIGDLCHFCGHVRHNVCHRIKYRRACQHTHGNVDRCVRGVARRHHPKV